MSTRLGLTPVLLIATLMVVAGCSMLTSRAGAGVDMIVALHSYENNGASQYIGKLMAIRGPTTIIVNFLGGPASIGVSGSPWTVQYFPETGFYFHRWVTEGGVSVSDPNANPTKMALQGDGVLRIIYGRSPPVASVGGLILPTNPFTALAPYLAIIGLVATAAVAVRKRRN